MSKLLTTAQRKLIGANPGFKTEFEITEGKSYLVYGIQFVTQSNIYGCATLFEIEDDADRLISIPAVLFAVSDPRVSRSWLAKLFDDGSFRLWPTELSCDYFHDDLSEGKAGVVKAFAELKLSLEREFVEKGESHVK